MELKNLSDKELNELLSEIKSEKDARWWNRVLEVAKQAKAIDEDYFQTVSDAMLYQVSESNTPVAKEALALMSTQDIKSVAYHLASISFSYHQKQDNTDTQNKETLVLCKRIKSFFSEIDFIFNWTHYDVCSNGYYYRMS